MRDCDRGYTLVELLMSLALTLIVVVSAIGLASHVAGAAYSQPEAMDAVERARLALARIAREVSSAGAGPTVGPAVGPLTQYFPAVHPRRLGTLGDGPDVARDDALSWVSVPDTGVQAALDGPSVGEVLSIRSGPGCPLGDLACGIRPGAALVVFDDEGRFEIRDVRNVSGGTVTTQVRGVSGGPFDAGMPVVEVRANSYYFDRVQQQVRQYDVAASDVVLVDGVADFRVRYFGRATPPSLPKPPLGIANCLYDVSGARRPEVVTLAATNPDMVELPLELFRDGPWCGFGPTRFDADLLRIRHISIFLRVAATTAASSSAGWRTVPEFETVVGVAPRNLQLD